jgi:hypothetical protein
MPAVSCPRQWTVSEQQLRWQKTVILILNDLVLLLLTSRKRASAARLLAGKVKSASE